MAVNGSWPPSCPQHPQESPALLSSYPPVLYHPSIPESTRVHQQPKFPELIDPDGNSNRSWPRFPASTESVPALALSPALSPFLSPPSLSQWLSTAPTLLLPSLSSPSLTSSHSAVNPPPSKSSTPPVGPVSAFPHSALNKARELKTSHCPQCRESLQIESPEVFKLILQLMTGKSKGEENPTAGSQVLKLDVQAACHILKELLFLAGLSSTNLQRLCSAGILVDILEHFRPILMEPKPVKHSKVKNTNKDKSQLQPLLLMLIQTLGSHNITVLELRKYFELMRSTDFPIELLDTLITMSKRDNIPSFHIDFSKNGLEYVEIPSLGERVWPPPKGYSLSMWFRVGSSGSEQNILIS